MKRISLTIGILLGLLTLAPLTAYGATSKPLNLVTSPLPTNLETLPGVPVSTDIRVKQNSGEDARLKVSLMKFGAFGEDGRPRLYDRGPGDIHFDWVKFDKSSFAAPNNVWQTVRMTINTPKSAAFGYYYAVVFSREGDDVRQSGNTNAINGGSAVLVLLNAKSPGAKKQVSIDSLVSKHGVYEFLPASFDVKLKNTGNVHFVPHGNVFIMKGKKQIAALNLNDEQGNILPGSKRIYPVEWTDGFPHYEKVVEDGKVKLDKNNKPVTKLVWGDSGSGGKLFQPHIRMGRYTAHLFAVYDDGKRDVPIEAQVSFWVIPWRLFLSIIIGLVAIFFIARFWLRRYKKRIMKQMRR